MKKLFTGIKNKKLNLNDYFLARPELILIYALTRQFFFLKKIYRAMYAI